MRRAALLLCLLVACGRQAKVTGTPGGDAGGDSTTFTGDQAVGDPSAGDPGGGDDAGDAMSGGDATMGGDTGPRFTCGSCHGNADNDAPPLGLGAETRASMTGVGAHQNHLLPSSWHEQVVCTACHIVPAAIDDAGHIDTPLPAELTFSGVALVRGASPSWDGATCDNTYCHGAPLMTGGTLTVPTWTTLDGTQDACGTCHGLPPGDTHPAGTSCEQCHAEIVDDTGAFIAPDRHVDGVVDITGCDLCHGDPPDATRESYPGGAGAHVTHVAQGFVECRTCHGHNGTGPNHAEGGVVVQQSNVDVIFDPVTFPGGTTMENLGTPTESYNGGNPTCQVGCHNPVPGDVADLTNASVWTDAAISCVDCHERPGTEPPFNHDLDPDTDDDATIRASCMTCHDVSQHTSGTLAFHDPDPSDGFSYAATGTSGLCRTCHDGSAGPYFVSGAPQNKDHYWMLPSAHQSAAVDCADCHGAHADAFGRVLVEHEEPLCFSCHDGSASGTDIAGEFAKGTAGADVHRHPVQDSEQSAGREVECTSCHEPHQALASNVLEGVAGTDVDGNSVAPAVRDIVEYELCFNCHGDSFNDTRPRTTNKRTDFAATNSSFHPVTGPGRNTSSAMSTSLMGGLDTGSTIRCTDCHNNEQTADVAGPASRSTASPQGPHGSTEAFILRGAYWADPTGPGTWSTTYWELCFNCHAAGGFTSESNTSATNFADGNENLHFKHVRDKADDDVGCSNCHYNNHSNESVTTTVWVIDGTTYDSPPAGFKTRGVSYSPETTPSGGYAEPAFWINTSTRERRCYVNCHGKNHSPENYNPGSQDNDPLTY